MQTFKLWFENDPDVPGFKKLTYENVEIGIKDVIEKGIHPWSYRNANRTLIENILSLVNSDEFKISELTELNYCEDINNYNNGYYYSGYDQFEDLLKRISQYIRFVEKISFLELIKHAKNQLTERWNHEIARKLANQAYYGFNQIRSFIKSKNKKIKLASYDDLDKYDLGEILKLQDFENNDKLIISEGFPATNFRSTVFLEQITDRRGFLKLTDKIDQFELQPVDSGIHNNYSRLIYNCRWKDGTITLNPTLTGDPIMRSKAKQIAEKWRLNKGRYCITIDINQLTEMHEDDKFKISFPRLDYKQKREPATSTAAILKTEIQRYAIGGYPTCRCSGDTIKGILRNHSVSMTGTKDKLLEKLAKLAVKLYKINEDKMVDYFKENRFLKVSNCHDQSSSRFPILNEVDIRNLIVTMFALRHLRGNSILGSDCENDTYELLTLAQSLINEEVRLEGSFLKIEN